MLIIKWSAYLLCRHLLPLKKFLMTGKSCLNLLTWSLYYRDVLLAKKIFLQDTLCNTCKKGEFPSQFLYIKMLRNARLVTFIFGRNYDKIRKFFFLFALKNNNLSSNKIINQNIQSFLGESILARKSFNS